MENEYKEYDHIHWSIIDDEPIDKDMGTTTTIDGPKKDQGKIVLLGRMSTGYHRRLYGPISKNKYWKVKDKKYSELIK